LSVCTLPASLPSSSLCYSWLLISLMRLLKEFLRIASPSPPCLPLLPPPLTKFCRKIQATNSNFLASGPRLERTDWGGDVSASAVMLCSSHSSSGTLPMLKCKLLFLPLLLPLLLPSLLSLETRSSSGSVSSFLSLQPHPQPHPQPHGQGSPRREDPEAASVGKNDFDCSLRLELISCNVPPPPPPPPAAAAAVSSVTAWSGEIIWQQENILQSWPQTWRTSLADEVRRRRRKGMTLSKTHPILPLLPQLLLLLLLVLNLCPDNDDDPPRPSLVPSPQSQLHFEIIYSLR
jgi:hypothetical protein